MLQVSMVPNKIKKMKRVSIQEAAVIQMERSKKKKIWMQHQSKT
jgi:hypothetical protein